MNARGGQFWDWYGAYLRSDKWRRHRQKVLVRDNYTCQACHDARATQVHHLTYAHVGAEPLFDLTSVCEQCHDDMTEADRAARKIGFVDRRGYEPVEPAQRYPGDDGTPAAFDADDELGFERVREVREQAATLDTWLPAIEEVL